MNFKKILPLIIALFAMPVLIQAQVTTSSISGVVKNKSGNALPGATITAVHEPTGTVYSTIARTGGRFDINNMNPGGPYTITSTFVGFEVEKRDDVFLQLGDVQRVDFVVSEKATSLEAVVVAGTRSISKNNNEISS